MSVSDQVEVQDILWLNEPDQDVLTNLTQAIDHEVICVDHQSEEVCQRLLDLAELICVQVLDDSDEVFPRNSTPFDLSNIRLLVDGLATFAYILVVLHDVQTCSAAFFKAVPRVKHDLEILASCKQHCAVGLDEVLAIKLKHDIEEVVQVATLSHLSHHLCVLLVDSVFWRLDYRVVDLTELELYPLL